MGGPATAEERAPYARSGAATAEIEGAGERYIHFNGRHVQDPPQHGERVEEVAGRESPETVQQALEVMRAADVRRAEVAGRHPEAWWELQARQDAERDHARAIGAAAWLSREDPESDPEAGA